MRLILLLALLVAGPAAADEAPWMRTVAVIDVTPPDGQEPADWLAHALNRAGDLQACSELLPAAPVGDAEEITGPVRLQIWDDGTVQSVDLSGAAVPSAAAECVAAVAHSMQFPEDLARSDERALTLSVRLRWRRARLDLLTRGAGERSAVVDVPEPTVEGFVDLVAIVAELARLEAPLVRCVSRRRRKVPDMGDRLDVQIRLSRDPADWSTRVDSLVVVDSTLGDEDAEVCVIRVLQRVRWPAPQGGMTARIVWPFVFGR